MDCGIERRWTQVHVALRRPRVRGLARRPTANGKANDYC
jgi:hypothetical protein